MGCKGLAAAVMAAAIGMGCAQHRTEYGPAQVAQGTITKQYSAPWMSIMPVGKVMVPISHPARYEVIVTTPRCEQGFSGREMYDRFADGQSVQATYRSRTDVAYEQTDHGERVLGRTSLPCEMTGIQTLRTSG